MAIISASDLADRLAAHDDIVIADVRFYLDDHDRGRREYTEGHIPGAVFVDLHHDLADVTIANAGRHPLPDPADFAAFLGRLGVEPDTAVVAYDDHGGAMAARLWWMLDSIGHRGHVAVLDGGISAWTDAGYELTGEATVPAPVAYPAPHAWTATISAEAIGDDPDRSFVVIDSRDPARYRGEIEPIDPKAGHIPGAINHFHGDVVNANGTFRPTDELAEHFAAVGPEPVAYCGSGVTACRNLLAMRLAGITDARLFPGSWSQWSSDPDRPIATGDE